MLPVTTLTAAVLGLFYVWLAIQVIRLRNHHHVSTGDGGHHDLTLAIRAHGNCAEYLPISLILLGLAELNQGEPLCAGGVRGLDYRGPRLSRPGLPGQDGAPAAAGSGHEVHRPGDHRAGALRCGFGGRGRVDEARHLTQATARRSLVCRVGKP